MHIYETYVVGRQNGHDETTCTQCIQRREDEEAELAARVRINARQASGEPSEDPEHHHHHHHYHHHRYHYHHHTHGHDDSDEMFDDDEDAVADERLRQARANAEAALGQDPDALIDAVMDEVNDDELAPEPEGATPEEEYIHNTCNGVCDIIATGEVRPPAPSPTDETETDGSRDREADARAARAGMALLPVLRADPQVRRAHRARARPRRGPRARYIHLQGIPRRREEPHGLVARVRVEPERDPARGPVHREQARRRVSSSSLYVCASLRRFLPPVARCVAGTTICGEPLW